MVRKSSDRFPVGVYRNWDAALVRRQGIHEAPARGHRDAALIGSRLRNAGLARIETERSANQLT